MDIVNSVSKSLTVEEATKYLGKYKVEVFDYIAEKILEKMKRLGNADFGVIIFNYNGEVISRGVIHEVGILNSRNSRQLL